MKLLMKKPLARAVIVTLLFLGALEMPLQRTYADQIQMGWKASDMKPTSM